MYDAYKSKHLQRNFRENIEIDMVMFEVKVIVEFEFDFECFLLFTYNMLYSMSIFRTFLFLFVISNDLNSFSSFFEKTTLPWA
jgi:hypothetical protein